jgi:hypothetical protein
MTRLKLPASRNGKKKVVDQVQRRLPKGFISEQQVPETFKSANHKKG